MFGSGKQEREEAARLGITVREVSKELPEFSAGGNSVTLETDRCMRYSIPRRAAEGPIWSLLQRTKALGATFPNDFLLTTDKPLPRPLEEELRRIADEYSEELFEFEGTAADVAVHWLEWGGQDQVRALHVHLERLASC